MNLTEFVLFTLHFPYSSKLYWLPFIEIKPFDIWLFPDLHRGDRGDWDDYTFRFLIICVYVRVRSKKGKAGDAYRKKLKKEKDAEDNIHT